MSSIPEPIYNPWIGFATLFRRETLRYLKLAVQTVVAPFLSQILFLAVFGGFYASRGAVSGGVPYLSFLVPGLVFSGAFLSAFQNPLFSLVAMKYQDTLKDFCLYPISASSRFFAFALSGAIRGLLVAAMTWAAAGLFAGFAIELPLAFWLYVAAVSFVAAAGGIAAGLLLDSFEKANFVVGLLVTPALYLSGIFYDVRVANPVLAALARFDPFTALAAAARSLYLGLPFEPGGVATVLAILLCAAFAFSAWIAMSRETGMKQA